MSLLNTLETKEVAFEWNSIKRVYRASELVIFDEPDRTDIELSVGRVDHVTQGVYLFFVVRSDYFQRLSPESDAGNDLIDLFNALDDGATTVDMYPIHDVDDTISYSVKPVQTQRTHLQTGTPAKTLYSPSAEIEVQSTDRLASLPTWLRMTRTR